LSQELFIQATTMQDKKKTTIAATKLISTLFASDITTKYPIWSLPQITISEFIEGKTSHRELV
jgi:hypothetical protein